MQLEKSNMSRTTLIAAIIAGMLSVVSTNVLAEETPQKVWIKAKCALCHGVDGASDTPTGKKTGAPDLREGVVQKMTDEKLASCIEKGHEKMPAFEVQLTEEEREILLRYVRDLAHKDAKK